MAQREASGVYHLVDTARSGPSDHGSAMGTLWRRPSRGEFGMGAVQSGTMRRGSRRGGDRAVQRR
eukprot:4503818-Alexandrium_andersonii.AAC.1